MRNVLLVFIVFCCFVVLVGAVHAEEMARSNVAGVGRDCRDIFHQGSVAVDIRPSVSQTVPGVPITFFGKIRNESDFPIVDGSLYVKILRRGGTDEEVHANGYLVADQWFVLEHLKIPAHEETSVEFAWQVPTLFAQGEYRAAFSFLEFNRYALSGIPFVDDGFGATADFSITSDTARPAVSFEKNSVQVNGGPYYFFGSPMPVKGSEAITVGVNINHPAQIAGDVVLRWFLYRGSIPSADTLIYHEEKTVTIPNGEALRVDFATKESAPEMLLAGEVEKDGIKSFLNVRLMREGATSAVDNPDTACFTLMNAVEKQPETVENTESQSIKDNVVLIMSFIVAILLVVALFVVSKKSSVVVLLLMAIGLPSVVSAKDTIFTTRHNVRLGNSIDSNLTSNIDTTVHYLTAVMDMTNSPDGISGGVDITDSLNVAVGTKLQFRDSPQSIIWTPPAAHSSYAIANAARPPSCANGDQVKLTGANPQYQHYIALSYVPLVPVISTSGTAKLTCANFRNCTVTAPGDLCVSYAFNVANAHFYGSVKNLTTNACNTIPLFQYQAGAPPETEYQFTVPARTLQYCYTVPDPNRPPTTPSISGPTTGYVNTLYSFSALSTDPDNDTLRYGFDWDRNNTVDQWVPAINYVNSGQQQLANYSWLTIGAKTFQVLAEDNKGAKSGWGSFTINIVNPPATPPIVSLTATSPINSGATSTLTYSWSNATSCIASSSPLDTRWNYSSAAPSMSATTLLTSPLTADTTYTLTCSNATPTPTSVTALVTINSLKVCDSNANTIVPNSFIMLQGATKDMIAYFGSGGAICSGTDVTGSTTWTETPGNSAVSLSQTAAPVKERVSADNTGSENISAIYSGQTVSMTANVFAPPPSCTCSDTNRVCAGQKFNDSCGAKTCTGTRSCDYNWKEVAP